MGIEILTYVVVAIVGILAWCGGGSIYHAAQGWMAHRDPKIRANLDRATHWPK